MINSEKVIDILTARIIELEGELNFARYSEKRANERAEILEKALRELENEKENKNA